MHARFMLLTLLAAASPAWAQVSSQIGLQPAPAAGQALQNQEQSTDRDHGRKNQKVERIHIEDKRTTIDEMRYGGQTESIVVQPKGDVPEYEIQPNNLSRSRPADRRGGMSDANGTPVWNFFKF
jgi:hypothetical protein